MSTFDELMYQLNNEDEDDTFESELLSLIDDDYDMYSEADSNNNDIEEVKDALNEAKKKAKIIKRSIIIALSVLAAAIGAIAIKKHLDKKNKNGDVKQYKLGSKRPTDQLSLECSIKMNDAVKYTKILKKEEKEIERIIEQINKGKFDGSTNIRYAVGKMDYHFDIVSKTIKQVYTITKDDKWFKSEKSSMLKQLSQANAAMNAFNDRRKQSGVSNAKGLNFVLSSANDTLYGYDNYIESAVDKYLSSEISLVQLSALSAKALERFDESTHDFSDIGDDEYSRIVDAICENYNNDELSPDDTIELLEKAAEKYLD